MATRVYLHIGPPKTGTTYLQHVLARNRLTLAAEGVCYPGDRVDHWFPAQDLIGWELVGYHDPDIDGTWQRLVEETRAWDGTVVISHEMFSAANDEQAKIALSALTTVGDVHVVYTARDLTRVIAAAWQEEMKNRWTLTFPETLEHLRAGDDRYPPAATLLHRQEVRTVLRRWSQGIPADHVHLVTVPQTGPPGLLWWRFAGVVGVDPDRFDTDVRANESLGVGEAEILRRLNLTLGDEVTWPAYHRIVKHYLANGVLAPNSASPRVVLPAEDHEWVVQWSRRMVDHLQDSGYHMIGDLDELLPDPPAKGRHNAEEAEIAAAGVTAVAGLVRRLAEVQDRRQRLQVDLEVARRDRDKAQATIQEHRDLASWERVKRCVVELGGQSRAVAAVLGVYRRVRRLAS